MDDFTTLLTDEGTLDTALVSDVSGAETTLYTDLSAPPSTTAIANALLDTTTGGAGDFNGAETAGFDGLYLDGLVTEDEVNQLVGATSAESQAEIESLVAADPSLLTASDVTLPELVTAEGSSAFDTDLTTAANADYTLALSDFEGYLASFATHTSGLSDVSTILTDLSSSFSDLSNLTPDLSTILADLTGGLL